MFYSIKFAIRKETAILHKLNNNVTGVGKHLVIHFKGKTKRNIKTREDISNIDMLNVCVPVCVTYNISLHYLTFKFSSRNICHFYITEIYLLTCVTIQKISWLFTSYCLSNSHAH